MPAATWMGRNRIVIMWSVHWNCNVICMCVITGWAITRICVNCMGTISSNTWGFMDCGAREMRRVGEKEPVFRSCRGDQRLWCIASKASINMPWIKGPVFLNTLRVMLWHWWSFWPTDQSNGIRRICMDNRGRHPEGRYFCVAPVFEARSLGVIPCTEAERHSGCRLSYSGKVKRLFRPSMWEDYVDSFLKLKELPKGEMLKKYLES